MFPGNSGQINLKTRYAASNIPHIAGKRWHDAKMRPRLATIPLVAAMLISGCSADDTSEPASPTGTAALEQRAKQEGLTPEATSDLLAGYVYCQERGADKLKTEMGLAADADSIDIARKVSRLPRWKKDFDTAYVMVGCGQALDGD